MSTARTLPTAFLKTARMAAVILGLLLVYAAMPAPARAANLTADQMQAVVNLLTSFGTSQSVLDNVQLALNGTSKEDILKGMRPTPPSGVAGGLRKDLRPLPVAASICATFARPLVRGNIGEDVSKLQEFLHSTGDLREASTSGYFGSVTEAAVKQWQTRMNIATSGDSHTTGFGALGPKTRDALLAHCKDHQGSDGEHNTASSSPRELREGIEAGDATHAPICMLRPNKTHIMTGESVILAWESKYATYAGSATGEKTAPHGAVQVTPTETTTFMKKVYGPDGEGACYATVVVGDDTTPAATLQIVIVPPQDIVAGVASSIGAGLGVIVDSYLSLFGL